MLLFQMENRNGTQATFLNPFTVCPSCKSIGCLPVFYEEINGSYPFANGLNRLAYLCPPPHRQRNCTKGNEGKIVENKLSYVHITVVASA